MRTRTPYRTCRFCGAHIDPGERCDCQKMQDRVYTGIEGARSGIPLIRYENMENRKVCMEK